MTDTWRYWSNVALGYIATQTPEIEYRVAVYKIQHHLNQGYSEAQIFLIWNQGHAGPCRAGTNKYGVRYDSCTYLAKGLAHLGRL